MSITHTRSSSCQSSGSKTISGSWSEVGSAEVQYDSTLAASTTNQATSIAFTVANVQSLFLLADKGATLKTNSTSAPDDTIVLKAGIPLEWSVSAGYFTIPFSADVTEIYISTTASTRVQIKVLTA